MKHRNGIQKTIAIILSMLMLFTIIPLGVSAEGTGEATPITNATEFLAMSETGNYYLANNIIITETYANVFSGTLDGRGNAIITTVPVFSNVGGGVIKNLTVSGSVTAASGVAIQATGSVIFENVTSSVTINHTTDVSQSGIGGIVAKAVKSDALDTSAEELVFINCTNSGNITATTSAANHMGGIIGYPDSVPSLKIINCKNTGTLTANGDCEVGGIAGRINKSIVNLTIENCINEGAITMDITTESARYAAGIVAWIYNIADYNVTNCLNSGTVTSMSAKKDNVVRVAGIVGRVDKPGYIIGCGNVADITAAHIASGIVGATYSSGTNATIAYCYNTGNITAENYASGILASGTGAMGGGSVIGCYNSGNISNVKNYRGQIVAFAKTTTCTLVSNFVIAGDSVANAYGAFDLVEPEIFTSEELASGKLAYDMNKAIGAQIYYQNLTDSNAVKYPTLNADDGAVIKSGDNYYSVRIETEGKAAVRIDGEKTGLRVTTSVNKADYDKLIAAGISANDLTFGTVFTADAYVEAVAAVGGVFSMADLDLYLADVETSYVNVPVAKKGTEGFYTTDADAYHFRGSLVNVAKDNLADGFSAIGYVKLGDDIIYSGYYTTVSIAEISEMAYEDRAEAADTTYTQTIAANSECAIGEVVTYSPYTEAQLKTLKGYYN